MDTIKLMARNGDAVRDAIELGDIVHLATASAERTDAFLLFAIKSGVLQQWAQGFPAPRKDAEIGMEVILAASLAARCAGIYALRQMGEVLQSALVVGELGSSVEVIEAGQGIARRGTGDAQVISGDVLRKLIVQRAQHVTLSTDALAGEVVDTRVGRVRERGSRRAVTGPVDARAAQGRGRGVGEPIPGWSTQCVGASLLAYAQVGAGRRLHSVVWTPVEVPLDSGHYAWSGVVKNADGSLARGSK